MLQRLDGELEPLGEEQEAAAEELEACTAEPELRNTGDGCGIYILTTMLRGLNAVGFDLAYLAKCAGQGTSHAESIAQHPKDCLSPLLQSSRVRAERRCLILAGSGTEPVSVHFGVFDPCI